MKFAARLGACRVRGLLLTLTGLACLVPWPMARPVDDATHSGTIARVEAYPGPTPLRAGLAVASLVPPRSVPLAGYIGEIAQPFRGINSPCRARCLSLDDGRAVVSILAVDLLLIDDRLARALLARSGLAPDQVYFTATHTHSGPGGWGLHPLERLVSGTYDPEAFEFYVATLADVILRSRRGLGPAEVAFTQVDIPRIQRNRIAPDLTVDDALSAWVFRRPDARPIATLAVFNAHATVGHPVPPRLGSDYPGAFAESLRERVPAGEVLFAAGAVGDAAPIKPAVAGHQAAAAHYGRDLAAALAPAFAGLTFRREIHLQGLTMTVDLPPVQYPYYSASLRFNPLLTWWISDRRARLQLLRLGPAVLVGFPGDYSSHLASRLRSPIPVVATSFAGDYKGYLVGEAVFRARSTYETRRMNFFGPASGDLLTGCAQGYLDRMLSGVP